MGLDVRNRYLFNTSICGENTDHVVVNMIIIILLRASPAALTLPGLDRHTDTHKRANLECPINVMGMF